VFEAHSFSLLYGAPANCKSFLALDWGLCIATARPSWNGRAVRAGPVIYVAGEGDRGIQKRADAWLRHWGVGDAPNFHLVRQAVQLRNGLDVPELRMQIDALNLKPALIIIDTLNRAFVGGDENSAQHMGEFLKGIAQLQGLGAAVTALHHTVKGGQDARGSGSLHGAADTMIFVERNGDLVTVENKKMKDDKVAREQFAGEIVTCAGVRDPQRQLTAFAAASAKPHRHVVCARRQRLLRRAPVASLVTQPMMTYGRDDVAVRILPIFDREPGMLNRAVAWQVNFSVRPKAEIRHVRLKHTHSYSRLGSHVQQ
jgi:hypothetical protein